MWSAFVGRGKSHRNLERRVCRKTIPFYLLEDKSGPGECGFKIQAVYGGRGQVTKDLELLYCELQ